MITKFNLSETEIEQNFQEFIDFVKREFKGERRERLLKMYDEDNLGLSLAMSPASTTEHFHLCHPGGYIQHVMNVVRLSFAQKKVFEVSGGKVDWTDEEMVFAALHHDLGKLGDPEFGDYYAPQSEEWKTRKGELKFALHGSHRPSSISASKVWCDDDMEGIPWHQIGRWYL